MFVKKVLSSQVIKKRCSRKKEEKMFSVFFGLRALIVENGKLIEDNLVLVHFFGVCAEVMKSEEDFCL